MSIYIYTAIALREMSIEYFKLCKTGYDTILHEIDYIISIYSNLENITKLECDNLKPEYIDLTNHSNKLKQLYNLKSQTMILQTICNKNIEIKHIPK